MRGCAAESTGCARAACSANCVALSPGCALDDGTRGPRTTPCTGARLCDYQRSPRLAPVRLHTHEEQNLGHGSANMCKQGGSSTGLEDISIGVAGRAPNHPILLRVGRRESLSYAYQTLRGFLSDCVKLLKRNLVLLRRSGR